MDLNFLAGTLASKRMSSSVKVRPLGSGKRKKVQAVQMSAEPAQKKAALAPH